MPGFDYSTAGYYFVTSTVAADVPVLAHPRDERNTQTALGDLVQNYWEEIPARFAGVSTDLFTVQPDHIHGIVVVDVQGAVTLSDVVRAFKSTSARAINKYLRRPKSPVWQRGYYERVIRNERELENVRRYIKFNWLKTLERRALFVGRRTNRPM